MEKERFIMKKHFRKALPSISTVILAVIIALSFASCGNGKTGDSSSAVKSESTTQSKATSKSESKQEDVKLDLTPVEDNSVLPQGTYFVGKDIKAGSYTLKCVEDLAAYTFKTEKDYMKYFITKRFTNGEEATALKKHAYTKKYLYGDDKTRLHLKEGEVLLIKYGYATIGNGTKNTVSPIMDLNSEVYYPSDIPQGTYMILASKKSSGVVITTFKDEDAYTAYEAEDPTTVGEDDRAKEKHALSEQYLYNYKFDSFTFLNMDSSKVVLVEYYDKNPVKLIPVSPLWK